MKPLRYHDLCSEVGMDTWTCSSLYLEAGDEGLTEDLIEGLLSTFERRQNVERHSIDRADYLIRELDNRPPDGRNVAMVVRTADRLFTPSTQLAILERLEREKRNARLRVIFVGAVPPADVVKWFLERRSYGQVTEPTFEKLGNWMAAKAEGQWAYRNPRSAIITPAVGLRLMEHVGWDYTAALQAAKTLRAYTQSPVDWPLVSALVPPKLGHGYADALVFGTGRRGAYTLAEGIVGAELHKTLGRIRFYLRTFAKLRAAEVENMSDRAVEMATGVHSWRWQKKYKPVYASYTNDRIRMRLEATEAAIAAARGGAVTGVLEVLVAEW